MFRITECSYGLPLLEGIKNQLDGVGNIKKGQGSYEYCVNGWLKNRKHVIPLFEDLELSREKQQQYDTFVKASKLCENLKHLLDLENLFNFIEIVWEMNQEGKGRKTTKEEMLKKAKNYIEKRRQTPRK